MDSFFFSKNKKFIFNNIFDQNSKLFPTAFVRDIGLKNAPVFQEAISSFLGTNTPQIIFGTDFD